jgi:chitodextrinase
MMKRETALQFLRPIATSVVNAAASRGWDAEGIAVTGLSPSTMYSFTVAASDSAGISSQSSSVSVTTGATGSQDTPPGTYTITVSGVAGSITHSAQLTLRVNWR